MRGYLNEGIRLVYQLTVVVSQLLCNGWTVLDITTLSVQTLWRNLFTASSQRLIYECSSLK